MHSNFLNPNFKCKSPTHLVKNLRSSWTKGCKFYQAVLLLLLDVLKQFVEVVVDLGVVVVADGTPHLHQQTEHTTNLALSLTRTHTTKAYLKR